MRVPRRGSLLCLIALSFLFLFSICASCLAEEFHNALSLQGFTGLLNTPNAGVTDEGRFYAIFSNQRESHFLPRNAREENYIFSVGLFSFVELGGRLTEAPKAARDLSANFKVKVPLIPKGYYLPDLAFGMQDVGGGSTKLRTKYLVATEDLWRLRFSVGYGSGPDRMKGVFGGAEIKAFDWLYLIGEHDTNETNVGIRLVSPEFFGIPVNLQVTAKSSLDHKPGNLDFGFGVQFPLGLDHHNKQPASVQADQERPVSTVDGLAYDPVSLESAGNSDRDDANRINVNMPVVHEPDTDNRERLTRLMERMAAAGFQNIRIGVRNDQLLVVEYENSRFLHNELDGLGVVTGIVVETVPTGYITLRLIMKKKEIRILEFSAPLKNFHLFLRDANTVDLFNKYLDISVDIHEDKDVVYINGNSRPSWLSSSLVLYPGIKTFVGSEVGVFDYLLSLKLDYYLNVWKGAVVNARCDIPVAWSENFDDGKAFRRNRDNSRLERMMLFQTLKLRPDLMINLGGGMVLPDAYGTLNEVMWTPGGGNHRFMFKQAYMANHDRQHQIGNNQVYLGSYRYYFDQLDLYVTGTGGKFLDNDRGFTIELKRFIGDTAFSVFYKNSRTDFQEHAQIGGVQLSFPLTLRREMKPHPVQLKGSDEWSYSQETKIVSPGSPNTAASIGVNPQPPYNLEHIFYNRDRLSEMYIRKHLLRLRDAYLIYLNK